MAAGGAPGSPDRAEDEPARGGGPAAASPRLAARERAGRGGGGGPAGLLGDGRAGGPGAPGAPGEQRPGRSLAALGFPPSTPTPPLLLHRSALRGEEANAGDALCHPGWAAGAPPGPRATCPRRPHTRPGAAAAAAAAAPPALAAPRGGRHCASRASLPGPGSSASAIPRAPTHRATARLFPNADRIFFWGLPNVSLAPRSPQYFGHFSRSQECLGDINFRGPQNTSAPTGFLRLTLVA